MKGTGARPAAASRSTRRWWDKFPGRNVPGKVYNLRNLNNKAEKTWGLKLYKNDIIEGDKKRIKGGTLDGMYWQQDGDKVFCTKKVLKCLDRQFGPRMFALSVEWPQRSPDLNPLDFFA